MSKTRVLYGVLLISALMFFVLYVDMLSIIVLLLVLILPLVMLAIIAMTSAGIRANITSPVAVATKDEGTRVEIQVENFSFFPVANARMTVCYKNNFSNQEETEYITIPIHANNKEKISFELSSAHCGTVTVELRRIQLYDFFKLFCIRKRIGKSCSVLVMPQTYDLDVAVDRNSDYIAESEMFSKLKSGDDPSEVFNIRDYAGGDKLNRIHWKLSSKLGDLLVKEYSLPVSHSFLILVELYIDPIKNNPMEYLDTIVETVFSLSRLLVQRETAHFIGWYDSGDGAFYKEEIHTEQDAFTAIAKLLEAHTNSDGNYTLDYHHKVDRHTQYSHVVYVTSRITQDVLSRCGEYQKMAPMSVLHVTNDVDEQPNLTSSSVEVIPLQVGAVQFSLRSLVL